MYSVNILHTRIKSGRTHTVVVNRWVHLGKFSLLFNHLTSIELSLDLLKSENLWQRLYAKFTKNAYYRKNTEKINRYIFLSISGNFIVLRHLKIHVYAVQGVHERLTNFTHIYQRDINNQPALITIDYHHLTIGYHTYQLALICFLRFWRNYYV